MYVTVRLCLEGLPQSAALTGTVSKQNQIDNESTIRRDVINGIRGYAPASALERAAKPTGNPVDCRFAFGNGATAIGNDAAPAFMTVPFPACFLF